MTELLHHEERGQGSLPVVLLHGFLGSGRNLRSLARRLHEALPESTIFLPDLLGHGASPRLGPRPSLEGMADALNTWWQAQGRVEPPALIGHSLGGRVALAASQAMKTEPLILLDIAPGPSGGFRGALGKLFEGFLAAPETAPSRDDMRRVFLEEGIPRPLIEWVILNLENQSQGVGWRVDRQALHALWRHGIDRDLWPVLAERHALGGHTLCIRGGDSSFVSAASETRLENMGAEVQTIPEVGHFVHVQALQAVVEACAQFIARVRSPGMS